MEDDDRQKKIGHYQDGHLTLLVQFPLPVLQGALPVTEICWFGNQHIHYNTGNGNLHVLVTTHITSCNMHIAMLCIYVRVIYVILSG
jgi:hypothetical protein